MGNLIKINMYAESKRRKEHSLKIKSLEANILNYNKWLKKNNIEDKIESYEEFLQAR